MELVDLRRKGYLWDKMEKYKALSKHSTQGYDSSIIIVIDLV